LNPKEIEDLRKEFEKIDTDNSGLVDAEELSKALKAASIDITDEQIEDIIKEIDVAGNREINYSEFIAATLSTK